MDKTLFSVRDLQKRWGKSRSTIYNMVKDGILKPLPNFKTYTFTYENVLEAENIENKGVYRLTQYIVSLLGENARLKKENEVLKEANLFKNKLDTLDILDKKIGENIEEDSC